MRFGKTLAFLTIGLLGTPVATRAGLFDLSVDGTSSDVNVNGSSLPDLLNNLTKAKGDFQSVNGQAYSASVKYGDLKNALTLDSNAAGTDVTLRIPLTGLTKEFTGANRAEVQNQLEDFLLKNGAVGYAKFVKTVNQLTVLGVVDGNPRASTAMMSDHAYNLFGINKPARTDAVDGKPAPMFSVDASAGVTDNNFSDETFYNLSLQTGIVGDRLGLTFSVVSNYRTVNSADSGSLGLELGVPIMLIEPPKHGSGFCWQVSPTALVAGGLSYDLAQGGTFWGVGVTSALSYQAGQFVFTLADQITHYDGFTITIGDYEFHTDVSQDIAKNGLGVAYLFGAAYVDASITYTNFLEAAAVDNYWSPTIGFGYRFSPSSGVHIDYRGDFADGYDAHSAEISLYFGY